MALYAPHFQLLAQFSRLGEGCRLLKSRLERRCAMSKKPDPQPPVVQQPIVQPLIVQPPIVQPMIDELRARQKPKEDTKAPPQGPVHPPQPAEQPAELDQDAGGGYNPDHTYPQP
jgi:hypothetical protein